MSFAWAASRRPPIVNLIVREGRTRFCNKAESELGRSPRGMNTHRILFGIQTPQQHTTWPDLLSLWQELDTLDYDAAWLFDHFCRSSPIPPDRVLKAGQAGRDGDGDPARPLGADGDRQQFADEIVPHYRNR
jgi:hypothetical protein